MTYIAHIYAMELSICTITYIEAEETDFQYIFEPNYENIAKLKDFRGIQGIDLSLQKKTYIRRNIMPSFIFEHNPLPGKKTFRISRNINGMCLLEYLVNSNKKYFGDKLEIRP